MPEGESDELVETVFAYGFPDALAGKIDIHGHRSNIEWIWNVVCLDIYPVASTRDDNLEFWLVSHIRRLNDFARILDLRPSAVLEKHANSSVI